MRAAFVCLLVVASALGAAAPAAADIFTVRGVAVDETADTAARSRERAISVGQLQAARRLIERLTLAEDRVLAPPLDEAQASRLVAGFQVEEEALAGARYIARLTVAFDPDAVRDLFESYGVPYVLSTARPTLVVPLWREGENTVLWDSNPWLDAWYVAGTADELVPVLAPSGDLRDISAIDAERAFAVDAAALERLAENYDAGGVIVALAAPAGPEGFVTARMVGIDFDDGGTATDYGTIGVDEPVALARAAAGLLQEDWKQRMVVRNPYLETLSVSVLFDTASSWRSLQDAVGGEPLVQLARLEALTDDGALMTIEHRGRTDQLALALRQHGAELREGPSGWLIMPRLAAPAGSFPASPPASAEGALTP